jgi:hypothetical protein
MLQLPSPARPSDLGVSYLVHEPNHRRPSKTKQEGRNVAVVVAAEKEKEAPGHQNPERKTQARVNPIPTAS